MQEDLRFAERMKLTAEANIAALQKQVVVVVVVMVMVVVVVVEVMVVVVMIRDEVVYCPNVSARVTCVRVCAAGCGDGAPPPAEDGRRRRQRSFLR